MDYHLSIGLQENNNNNNISFICPLLFYNNMCYIYIYFYCYNKNSIIIIL